MKVLYVQEHDLAALRPFVLDATECDCCATIFNYFLPLDLMPFWDGLCPECNKMVVDLPEKPGIEHMTVTFMQ